MDADDLLKRLREAKGRNPELNARMSVFAGVILMRHSEKFGYSFWEAPMKKGDWAFLSHCHHGEGEALLSLGTCLNVADYTGSIDAIVSLIERELPGMSWECRRSGSGDAGQAMIWNPRRRPGGESDIRAFGCATPALALCVAFVEAMKYRAQGNMHSLHIPQRSHTPPPPMAEITDEMVEAMVKASPAAGRGKSQLRSSVISPECARDLIAAIYPLIEAQVKENMQRDGYKLMKIRQVKAAPIVIEE